MTTDTLDTFTRAYVECALWSSTDEHGNPLDDVHTIDDIAPATLAKMIEDCADFQKAAVNEIYGRQSRAGHDFWLTRNHHGAGFWDGDWKEPAATALTDLAHGYGSVDLYVGDDGFIHSV